jgi:hypothetical protein
MTKSRGLLKQPRKGAKAAFIEVAVAYTGSACLLWPYHRNWYGYGVIEFRGQRNYRVHRIVCERTHGAPPGDGPGVAHSCRNTSCVAPAHLRWASQKENLADRVSHGTMIRGSRQWLSKLTEGDIPRIRALAKDGMNNTQIAKRFNVRRETISAVTRGKTWAWL